MVNRSKEKLYFLWREHYVTYFWANAVTAQKYFLKSGMLVFRDGVLSAYADNEEINAIKKSAFNFIRNWEDILRIEKKFADIRARIQKVKKTHSPNKIKNCSDRELYRTMLFFVEIFREYLYFYKYTDPYYVKHIETRALSAVKKRHGKAHEKIFAEIIVEKKASQKTKNSFDKDDILVFNLLKKISKVRFKAKTIDKPLVDCIDYLTAEVAKRKTMAVNQVYNLGMEEFKRLLLDNKMPKMELVNKRHHFFALRIRLGESTSIRHLTERQVNKLLNNQNNKKNEVRGFTAYPGVAFGTVRIPPFLFEDNDFKEYIKSLKKDDVLIAPMTSPKITPAFSRVAAVITDEGGLMSHAALIAREKKIPCIVGTSNATIIFKDGDKVKVDADNGLAVKINK